MYKLTVSRRGFVTALGLMSTVGVAYSQVGTPAFAAGVEADASTPGRWMAPLSANGWPLSGRQDAFRVEGAGVDLRLAVGSVSALLLHAARRINYEVDSLRPDDLEGQRTDSWVESPERSNLLSGTAFLFRQGAYPWGANGNLYPQEVAVFEDIVERSEGVLAWGGHLETPDQGLIYVSTPPADAEVSQLARQYTDSDRMDSGGGVGQFIAFGSG